MAKRVKPTPTLASVTHDVRTSLEGVNRSSYNENTENAIRTNLSMPKDGTEDYEAPFPFLQLATASLPDEVEWEGAMVYDTDAGTPVYSDGANWVPLQFDIPIFSTDPGADSGLFWDESDNAWDVWTPVAPLSFSGNTLVVATASETDLGVVDLATDAEIRSAATGAHVITADALESAAAPQSLTPNATVALDWDSGIAFTLAMDGNHTLQNPTNGQPGTWRTVLVTTASSTRTLSFDTQYVGPGLTALTDITSSKSYLVTIYCASTSSFWVGYLPQS